MASDGAAIAAGAIGVGLLWSALNNKGLLATAKDIVAGKKPVPGTQGGVNTVVNPNVAGEITGVQGIPVGVAAQGSPSANKALGLMMATAMGWGGSEWPYLETGWQEESGWDQFAANDPSDPYNHAYGIPQANPGSKMATAGSDWKSSVTTQIRWGLTYIKETYGAPSRVPGWTPTGPAAGYVGY